MADDTSAPIPGLPSQSQEPPPAIPTPAIPPQPGLEPESEPGHAGWQVPPTQSIILQPGYLSPPVPESATPTPPFPAPFPAPAGPAPAGAGRRRRPPLWALIAGGFALVGLVVGLVIWAPWSPPPQAPTAVRVSSPTATTALVSWTAPKGGATPDQYNIMRDGKEQGIVPGSHISWTDTGLAPGSKHSYAVITVGNGQKSAPSVKKSVITVTPAPLGVTATDKTYTTVTLHWSPPANAPTPDTYTIYDTSTGKDVLDRLDSSLTSYTVTRLVAGDDYSFAVTASWGSAESAFSQELDAPPLSMPLSGSVPVNLKVTKILPGSTGLKVGQTWADNWSFSANCPATSCTLTDKGSLVSNIAPFTIKLKPANGSYAGQATHVQFSHCGGANSYETVTVRIAPNRGGVSNGAWTAWHGTMTLAYPGQTVGDGYCSAGDWNLTLTGTGS